MRSKVVHISRNQPGGRPFCGANSSKSVPVAKLDDLKNATCKNCVNLYRCGVRPR